MSARLPPGDPYELFWRIARQALAERLITPPQLSLIARSGTRKAPYWSRHLHDLLGFLADRDLPPAFRQSLADLEIVIARQKNG